MKRFLSYLRKPLFYLFHWNAAYHRLRQMSVGNMYVGYFLRRLGSYLRQPKALIHRIGLVHFRGRPVVAYGEALTFFIKRPRHLIFRLLGVRMSTIQLVEQVETGRHGGLMPDRSDDTFARTIAQRLFEFGKSRSTLTAEGLFEGTRYLEAAQSLSDNAEGHLALGTNYIRINRQQDAIRSYWRAFLAAPDDPGIRYHLAIQVMRHGSPAVQRRFFDRAMKRDPSYKLGKLYYGVQDEFGRQMEVLKALPASKAGKRFFLGVPVWGKEHIDGMLDYLFASMMAPGNLPYLAKAADVTVLVFTRAEDQVRLDQADRINQIRAVCRVEIVALAPFLFEYARDMDTTLSNPAKFAIMSLSHYLTVETARVTGGFGLTFGADNVVNGRFLTTVDEITNGDVSAISVLGFRLNQIPAFDFLEKSCRTKDGFLDVGDRDFARLLYDHLPKAWFVDHTPYSEFPIMSCWRVKDEGILVHANHLAPFVINGRYIHTPLTPSIDPVDGRFLDRYLRDLEKVHIVQGPEMAVFDGSDNPLVTANASSSNTFGVERTAIWLWQFWDRMRGRYLSASIRFPLSDAPKAATWEDQEVAAQAVVTQIIGRVEQLSASVEEADIFASTALEFENEAMARDRTVDER